MLVTSPGTHDCMHYPAEFYHHGLEMRRYAQHLHTGARRPLDPKTCTTLSKSCTACTQQRHAAAILPQALPLQHIWVMAVPDMTPVLEVMSHILCTASFIAKLRCLTARRPL